MYGWIWRHLPGGAAGKTLSALVLVIVVVTLLFFVAFPLVEARLPFQNVTVGGG